MNTNQNKMSNMKEVDRTTDELIRLESIMVKGRGDAHEFKVDSGTLLGWSLYKEEGLVEVARGFMSTGAVFPLHDHPPSTEVLVLYSGVVDIACEVDGELCDRKPLVLKEPIVILPGEKHILYAKEDSKFIAMFFPPDTTIPID